METRSMLLLVWISFSETFTGNKPAASSPVTSVANFNTTPTVADKFILQTTANIPFTEASNMARKTFLNKEFDIRDSQSKSNRHQSVWCR